MVWQVELEEKLERVKHSGGLCILIEDVISNILENGSNNSTKINKSLINKIFEALNQSFIDNNWSCCNSCLRFVWTLIQNNNLKYNEIEEKNVKILLNVYYKMVSLSKKNQIVELEFATMLRNITGFFMSWVDEYYLLNNKLSFNEAGKNYLNQHVPIFMKDDMMLEKYIFSLFDLFTIIEPKRSNCNGVLEYLFIGHSYILSSRYAAETYTMIQQINSIQKKNVKFDSNKLVDCINRFLYCPDFELQLILGELVWRILKKIEFGGVQRKPVDEEYIDFINSFRSSWPEGLIQLRYINGENFDYSFRGLLTPWNKTCNGNGMNIWSLSGIKMNMSILNIKLTTDIDICAFSITFHSDIDEDDYVKLRNATITDTNIVDNSNNTEKELKPHLSSAEIPYWTIKSVLYNEIESELSINIVLNELLEIKQSWTGLFASNIENVEKDKKNEILKISFYIDEEQANHIMGLFRASKIEKIYGMRENETPSRKVSIADSRAILISQSNLINEQFNIIESVEPSMINFENIKMSIATTKNFRDENKDYFANDKTPEIFQEDKVRRVSFVTSKECRKDEIKLKNNREINKNENYNVDLPLSKNDDRKDKKNKKIKQKNQKNKADIIIIGLLNEQKKLTQEMEEINNSENKINNTSIGYVNKNGELENKSEINSGESPKKTIDKNINVNDNSNNNDNRLKNINRKEDNLKSVKTTNYVNRERKGKILSDTNKEIKIDTLGDVTDKTCDLEDKKNSKATNKKSDNKNNNDLNKNKINNNLEGKIVSNKSNKTKKKNIEKGIKSKKKQKNTEIQTIKKAKNDNTEGNSEKMSEMMKIDEEIDNERELKSEESKLNFITEKKENKFKTKTCKEFVESNDNAFVKTMEIPSLNKSNTRVSCLKRGRIQKKNDEDNEMLKKKKPNEHNDIEVEKLNICNINNNDNTIIKDKNVSNIKKTMLKRKKNKEIEDYREESIDIITPPKFRNNVTNGVLESKIGNDEIKYDDGSNSNKEITTVNTLNQTTCPTRVNNEKGDDSLLNRNVEKIQAETIVPKEIAVTDNNYPILEECKRLNDLESKKLKYSLDTRSEKLFNKWHDEINGKFDHTKGSNHKLMTPEVVQIKKKYKKKKKSIPKIDEKTMRVHENNNDNIEIPDGTENGNQTVNEEINSRIINESSDLESLDICDYRISDYTEKDMTDVEIAYENKYSLNSVEKISLDDNNTILYSPDQFDDSITLTNYSSITKLESEKGVTEMLPSELKISSIKLEEKKDLDNMINRFDELNKKLLNRCNKEVENYFTKIKKHIENMWNDKLNKFKERRRELNVKIEKNRINIENEYKNLNDKYIQYLDELYIEIIKETKKLKGTTNVNESDNINNKCNYISILNMKNELEKGRKLMCNNIEKLKEKKELEKNKYENNSKSSKLNLKQLLKKMIASED
ncbi:hypothetical protein FG379_000289 [Cryptosporidium bovis]|uniref:uncharacterized protein n=1 Tax=Cryptosporidium bovis TaxID=310047 RepID=UPI00351A2379|nr:hypothetical protein FG379_000289 [Cryptosporidium bovis]